MTNDALPDDPEEFVTLWTTSYSSSEVAWAMKRPLAEVLEWAQNLRDKGVRLPRKPIRRASTPRPTD